MWPSHPYVVLPQTVAMKFKAHSGLERLCMLRQKDFTSLKLRGSNVSQPDNATKCTKQEAWKHSLTGIKWKSSSDLHRALTWTPRNGFRMNWNVSSIKLNANLHSHTPECLTRSVEAVRTAKDVCVWEMVKCPHNLGHVGYNSYTTWNQTAKA